MEPRPPRITQGQLENAGAASEPPPPRPHADSAAMARKLRDQGSIAFSAATEQGNWDLFLMRPDGSQRRAITRTPDYHEAGVRFSPTGKRMLYYRIPASDPVDNNTYGTYELMLADADGANAETFGRGFSWASWGPDGTQLACLDQRGIRFVDIASRGVVRQLARKGIVEQLVWSPDGNSFAGTANGLGPFWNIGRMDAQSGLLYPVSETERYNCTPDWLPDSRHILYSRRNHSGRGRICELWMAAADGSKRRMLYAEPKRHIYGGCASPDGEYLLFTRSEVDLGARRRFPHELGHHPDGRHPDGRRGRGRAARARFRGSPRSDPRPFLGLGTALDQRPSPPPGEAGALRETAQGRYRVSDGKKAQTCF